ncbi:MAG: dockerin type I repeat-containing protein, partial [Candidatus Zixiibacteriota bacterium]
ENMMSRVSYLLSLRYIFAAAAIAAVAAAKPAQAQPDLIVNVGDVTAHAGQLNTNIPIFVDNFSDTVAGVELWIRLERPGVAIFQTSTDTVQDTTLWNCLSGTFPNCSDSEQVFDTLFFWRCVPEGAFPSCTDSIQVVDPTFGFDWITTATYDFLHVAPKVVTIGNFDTTGTLMQGWEFVTTSTFGGQGLDIKISALANEAGGGTTPGFGQQTNGKLINLLADVIIPADDTDRTISVSVIAKPVDNFSFSDENGGAIGITTIVDTTIDSTFFFCSNWIGGTCFEFTEVPTPPFDSLFIDTIVILRGELDTNRVFIFDGSLTVLLPPDCVCGDANGDTKVNIADVTYLITRLFAFGPSPMCNAAPNNWPGDPNGDCKVNIADITFLIARIFAFGPAPAGCCAQ